MLGDNVVSIGRRNGAVEKRRKICRRGAAKAELTSRARLLPAGGVASTANGSSATTGIMRRRRRA
jgi:hypothetical protein